MDTNAKLIGAGVIGAALSALCCLTPALVFVTGALGLAAYAAKADSILIPAFVVSLGLMVFGLGRRRRARNKCEARQTAEE